MGVKRTYEADRERDYAAADSSQVVSRSLFAVIERGDMPLDGGFGEAEIIEVESPDGEELTRVRIDTVPQDTIAANPDAAATAAMIMQGLGDSNRGQLGFRVEYSAD